MRRLIPVLLIGLVLAGCGGDDAGSDGGADAPQTTVSADDGDMADGGDDAGSTDGGAPEPIGPAEMNTIRIGDETWERTLPMTQGQCFVYEEDGTLPTSGVVWGPLEGDDDIRFSVNYRQDGTFEAEVRNDRDMYWLAGERNPDYDDLTIELDFDDLTIVGSGTFTSLITGEDAAGSFAFQCEPDDG